MLRMLDNLFEDELKGLHEEWKEKVLLDYRWLKQAGVYVGSERKQRALSNKLVGDNLEVELGLFSFQLSNGGVKILTHERAWEGNDNKNKFKNLFTIPTF